jgi:flagellar biosynthesis protein FliQ
VDPTLLAIGREALLVVLTISAPPLLAALVVGVAAGVLQAATQVQEQSLTVVPRLAAVLITLACAGAWMGARLLRFAATCIDLGARIAP